MEGWLADAVIRELESLKVAAIKGRDKARAAVKTEANKYTVNQMVYWSHVVSALKWAIGQVELKSSAPGRRRSQQSPTDN